MDFGLQPRPNRRARSDVVAQSPRGASRAWQIGPRIRVGGTLGHIGQEVKIGAGKLASNPLVEGIAGAFLGPEASAALGALGKTLDTSNGGLHGIGGVGQLAVGGLKGAAAGYAGSKLAGLAGAIKNGGLSGGVQALGGMIPGLAKDAGGLTSALGLGGGVQGLGDLAKYGLGAAQMVNQAQLQKKSNDYATTAYDGAKSAYDAKAPLRQLGQAGLMNAGQGNPFATRSVQPLPMGGG